ncbi:MAG: hypothetical protein COT59_00725 [Candidatus Nealsonbacteria bacterium CG09_land_8_20_14_0_10_42_14]|uniref:TIGR00374 family protein n=1 Tax=Candidatus Nealsonbacteria bacterium CG09_land_8_20_14_0_10_42_14 TaxID=1974707 RepID=A0A2H0WXT4_9BACT|nr:MAG: hypothetical protein COT59_00725 [Candidatus Nealsonbacteria bacterium CG09_land_8_20_14_0_10_42_14]
MPDKKFLKRGVRIIGIVLFVYILSKVNWPEFSDILREINIFYFILGILLIIPAVSIRALRWREIVNSLDAGISKKTSIIIFAKGLFWGVITPGKLGEFSRAKYLAEKSNISLDKALFTVVFDKLIEFFAAVFLSIPAVLALFYLFEVDVFLIMLILSLLVISGIYFLIKRESAQKVLKPLFQIFIFDSLKKKAEDFFHGFFEETKRLTRALIVKLFCYELVIYLLTLLVFFLMTLSLGITVPLWYLGLMIPLVSIVAVLPVSVFGLGTREAGLIFLFSLINLSLNQAVAFSFLIMFWSILSGVPGLILTFLPAKTLKV